MIFPHSTSIFQFSICRWFWYTFLELRTLEFDSTLRNIENIFVLSLSWCWNIFPQRGHAGLCRVLGYHVLYYIVVIASPTFRERKGSCKIAEYVTFTENCFILYSIDLKFATQDIFERFRTYVLRINIVKMVISMFFNCDSDFHSNVNCNFEVCTNFCRIKVFSCRGYSYKCVLRWLFRDGDICPRLKMNSTKNWVLLLFVVF